MEESKFSSSAVTSDSYVSLRNPNHIIFSKVFNDQSFLTSSTT